MILVAMSGVPMSAKKPETDEPGNCKQRGSDARPLELSMPAPVADGAETGTPVSALAHVVAAAVTGTGAGAAGAVVVGVAGVVVLVLEVAGVVGGCPCTGNRSCVGVTGAVADADCGRPKPGCVGVLPGALGAAAVGVCTMPEDADADADAGVGVRERELEDVHDAKR